MKSLEAAIKMEKALQGSFSKYYVFIPVSMSNLMSSSENVASEARTQLELEVRPGQVTGRLGAPTRLALFIF